MKDAEIEKTKYSPTDKTAPSGYPKMANSRPYLVPIFQEKYDYWLLFVLFWLFFSEKKGMVTLQRVWIKI